MKDIIVSFTSYPDRILTINKVIDSIIKQTILPDKIILYLSSLEFENLKTMPDLTRYEEYGFEIHWYKENLKSHKKWFYVLQEYPDDIVITIDDDILYNNTALEKLLKYHEIHENAVIARRAHLITCTEDGVIASYNDWYKECSLFVGIPRMDLLATTGAGTLFPPHVFNQELFNKDIFMKMCPYSDDIWMKVMEVYSGIPVVLAEKSWDDSIIFEYQASCLFQNYNKDNGNDKQFKNLLNYYSNTHNGKLLKECLFSHGKILYSDIMPLKIEEMKTVLDEFILKLQGNNKFFIYGAGMIARKIYKLLQEKDIDNINAFIVNDIKNNVSYIGNIPVEHYKKFVKNVEKVIIAIFDSCESYKIYEQLVADGFENTRLIFLTSLEKQALLTI